MRTRDIHTKEAIANVAIPRPLMVWMGVNLCDAVLTYVLLAMGGIEGNPLLSHIASQMGGEIMLVTKLTLALAVGFSLVKRGRTKLLVPASFLMGGIVVYNAIVLAYYLFPAMGIPFTF